MNPPHRFDRLDLFAQEGARQAESPPAGPIDELTTANRDREAEAARQRSDGESRRLAQERLAVPLRDNPAATTLSRLADWRLLDVTESYLSLVGFERDEIIGRSAAELGLLPAEQIEEIARRVREEGAARDLEIVVRTKAGDTRHLLVSLERVEVGDELCALSIVYDLTGLARNLDAR